MNTALASKLLCQTDDKAISQQIAGMITKLIHDNQYGFVKEHTIQECMASSFEYLHLCKQSKKELVILKLDFEKAHKLEHNAIIDILKHKGFGPRWLMWMEMIMNSGTSSVLLNGVPEKSYHCIRGSNKATPFSTVVCPSYGRPTGYRQ